MIIRDTRPIFASCSKRINLNMDGLFQDERQASAISMKKTRTLLPQNITAQYKQNIIQRFSSKIATYFKEHFRYQLQDVLLDILVIVINMNTLPSCIMYDSCSLAGLQIIKVAISKCAECYERGLEYFILINIQTSKRRKPFLNKRQATGGARPSIISHTVVDYQFQISTKFAQVDRCKYHI